MAVPFSKARQDDTAFKALHFCAHSDICFCPLLIADEDKSAVRDRGSLCPRKFLIDRIYISVYHFVCCLCHLLYPFLCKIRE